MQGQFERKVEANQPDKMSILKPKPEITKAMVDREMRQLFRLQTLIDVVYGIMLFRIFLFLPRPEVDGFGAKDLVKVLSESYLNYLMIIVGIFMLIVYWGQSNMQFGNLERTRTPHAILSILQVVFLLLYFYFVRLDVQFDGAAIALQMESIFLALAGLMSILGWHYAVKNHLIADALSEEEKYEVYLKLYPEPIVSVLTFPFAFFGPDAWTASWLLLIPVTMITKRIIHNIKTKSKSEPNPGTFR